MPTRNPSPPWRSDPIILDRLTKVETLHLQGAHDTEIAAALGIDRRTVYRDLARLKVFWQERAGDKVQEQKERSVAVYRNVQQAAWQEFKTARATSPNKPAFLNNIKTAEDSIGKVLGLEAPVKVASTDPTGTIDYAGHALALRAAELHYLAALGLKPGDLGEREGDADSPDARAYPLPTLSLSGPLPDGSVATASDRESAADRV